MKDRVVVEYKGTYRELKQYLMRNDPHCYYCGIEVVDYGKIPDGTTEPNDMATIDHTISRFYRNKNEIVPKVLACNYCNKKRAAEEQKLFKKGKTLPSLNRTE